MVTATVYREGMREKSISGADESLAERPDRTYLVDVDRAGGWAALYLVDGRFGARGAFRLTDRGWVPDRLPFTWVAGGANHLDPVRRTWAMRHAAELGVDEAAFEPPSA